MPNRRPYRLALPGLILVALLVGGCSTRPSPGGPGAVTQASPRAGSKAPVFGGNAEGYLGPHTSGVAIPSRLDQPLSLGEVRGAIERCLDSLLWDLRAQTFRYAFDLDGARTRRASGYRPQGPEDDRLTIVYAGQWRATLDYPLPPEVYGFKVQIDAGIPFSLLDQPMAPFKMELYDEGDAGTPPHLYQFVAPAGLPQVVYLTGETEKQKLATARDSAWVDDIDIRLPTQHGIAVPLNGTVNDQLPATVNTVEYAECLRNETLRWDSE